MYASINEKIQRYQNIKKNSLFPGVEFSDAAGITLANLKLIKNILIQEF